MMSHSDTDFVFDADPDSDECSDADVIVGGGIVPEVVLEKSKRLKLVVVPFVGVDHLPLELLKNRGVMVANSHGNSGSVAERTVGMILAFYGRIISYHQDLKDGGWHGFWVGKGLDDSWESIAGKGCSIIGAGKIGDSLARMLKGFNCRITGFKKRKVSEINPVYDEMTYDFLEAVDKSEIIINILPLTEETRNIFNKDIFDRMKDKFFVNVGRGGSVDEEALYNALKEGQLKGAAIDTWFAYPESGSTVGFPSSYPYHELDNVILSPHIAGFTRQAAAENIRQAFENLKAYLGTGKPLYMVDLDSGY